MSTPLTRAAATRLLAERLTNEVVVSNLGQASMDLQTLADISTEKTSTIVFPLPRFTT